MKPWFVLLVLWALSGIVVLRHAYEIGDSPENQPLRSAQVTEEPSYVF